MREGVEEFFRHAIGKVLLIMFRAEIGEGKDRDGFARDVVRQRLFVFLRDVVEDEEACDANDEECSNRQQTRSPWSAAAFARTHSGE